MMSSERTVGVCLSKRRYMSPAMPAHFDEAERWDKEPNAPVASELPGDKCQTEAVPVKDLASKLGEIIRGESIKINP